MAMRLRNTYSVLIPAPARQLAATLPQVPFTEASQLKEIGLQRSRVARTCWIIHTDTTTIREYEANRNFLVGKRRL